MSVTTIHRAPAPAHGSVADWVNQPLEWLQPHGRRSEWELMAAGQRIGTLAVRGIFREETHAQGPSGVWRFRGGWTGHTEIAQGEASVAAARYEPRWRGGEVTSLGSGLRFRWKRQGFWSSVYVLATDSDTPCVTIVPKKGFTRFGAVVTIEPAGRRLAEIEPLVFLGWRLMLSERRASGT